MMMSTAVQQSKSKEIEHLFENTDFACTVFASIADYAILAGDLEGNIVAFNEGASQIYGYAPAEIVGKKRLEALFPDDFVKAGKLRKIFAELQKAGRVSYEGEKVRRSGHHFAAQILFVVTKNRDNDTVGFVEIVQDITKRKRHEDEIAAINKEFKTTFDSISDLISIHDASHKLVRVNRAFAAKYGKKPEQLIGKTCYEVVHGTSEPVDGCPHRKALKTGKSATLEYYDSCSDAYLLTTASPIFDDTGDVVGSVHLTKDITERKRIEQRWWDSMSNFHRLVNTSTDGMVIIDKTNTVLFVNPAAEVLFGRKQEEFQGNKFDFPLEPGKVTEINILRNQREKVIADMSVVETVWFDESAYLASIRDITERRLAEEKLSESEKLYSTMANCSPAGVFIIRDGKFVFANQHFCTVSGYTESELIASEALSLVHPEDRYMVKENAIKMLKSERSEGYKYRVINKNGESRIIFETITSIRYRGERASLGSNVDITEREQHLQDLEGLSRQLQAKVKELETFTYGIAHDLRSPLISIDGFSRLLREDLDNGNLERVEEDIRLLESGARKMHDFLNSTLEYSRAGQMVKRVDNVSFGKIAREIINDHEEFITARKGRVTIAKAFPMINADKIRIRQVLDNLVRNSIKYQDASRPLEIEIGHRRSDGETVFFLHDNGLGISQAELPKVFDLFYRGTSESKGSGVGLAVVKSIIEAHGGRIWLESQPGQGTTFYFTLPRQDNKEAEDRHGEN